MDKFNGFSQDEIDKVSGGKSKPNELISTKGIVRGAHIGIRRMPDIMSKSKENFKKPQVTKKASAMATSNEGVSKSKVTTTIPVACAAEDSLDDVNLDRSMSKSLEEALFYPPMQQNLNGHREVTQLEAVISANNTSILQLPAMDCNVTSTSSMDDSSILPTTRYETTNFEPVTLNVDSPFKGISLKDFEVHRKMIEEQNKSKKEMLYKAIEHHSQKTAAEARKIEEIKGELAKLDNDLALDVAILRKQIDNACIQFANIEKQYMKIEAQFLKAKIDLHNAAEKKELLTEHLCTVIAHNEDRKAQKLSELMEKVGLTPTGEYRIEPTQSVDM